MYSSPLVGAGGVGVPSRDFSVFEDFYKLADARDTAMAENLIGAIHQNKSNVVVLVSGGYHSSGISKLLSESNINVVEVTPKISHIDSAEGTAYLSIFAQEKTPLDQLFQQEKLFLSIPPFDGTTQQSAGVMAYAGDLNQGRSVPLNHFHSKLSAMFFQIWKRMQCGREFVETV